MNLSHLKQKFLEVLDFFNVNVNVNVNELNNNFEGLSNHCLCLRCWGPDAITGKGVGEKID